MAVLISPSLSSVNGLSLTEAGSLLLSCLVLSQTKSSSVDLPHFHPLCLARQMPWSSSCQEQDVYWQIFFLATSLLPACLSWIISMLMLIHYLFLSIMYRSGGVKYPWVKNQVRIYLVAEQRLPKEVIKKKLNTNSKDGWKERKCDGPTSVEDGNHLIWKLEIWRNPLDTVLQSREKEARLPIVQRVACRKRSEWESSAGDAKWRNSDRWRWCSREDIPAASSDSTANCSFLLISSCSSLSKACFLFKLSSFACQWNSDARAWFIWCLRYAIIWLNFISFHLSCSCLLITSHLGIRKQWAYSHPWIVFLKKWIEIFTWIFSSLFFHFIHCLVCSVHPLLSLNEIELCHRFWAIFLYFKTWA